MCDCEDITGITIATGDDGDDGAQGGYGGFSTDWIWETNTGSGPGSTFIRMNNATFASVTSIYVNETNGDSVNVAAFLTSFGSSGNIRLFKETDPTSFWMGSLTANTDNGTDRTLTVTYIVSSGSFAAGDRIVMTYTAAGGNTVLYDGLTTTAITSNSPSYTAADSYTIVANTVATNGNVIKIKQNFTKVVTTARPSVVTKVKLTLTSGATTALYDYSIAANYKAGSIITEISRISSTTALISVHSYNIDGMDVCTMGKGSLSRTLTVTWTGAVALSAEYLNDSASAITHQQLLVEHHKI